MCLLSLIVSAPFETKLNPSKQDQGENIQFILLGVNWVCGVGGYFV